MKPMIMKPAMTAEDLGAAIDLAAELLIEAGTDFTQPIAPSSRNVLLACKEIRAGLDLPIHKALEIVTTAYRRTAVRGRGV